MPQVWLITGASRGLGRALAEAVLEAGHLLYLPTGELHSVKGIENASLLVTVLLPKP